MSSRRLVVQRQVLSLLKGLKEPHGGGVLIDPAFLRGVEVSDEGGVVVHIRPSRPHCPCCLLHLSDLRESLAKLKKVEGVTINVVEIPDAERWTKAVNE